MIKVSAILYTSKKLSNGEHPILIRLTQNGRRKYISLGISCFPHHWDKNIEQPSKKHPNQKELSILLSDMINNLRKMIFESETLKDTLSIDDLAEEIYKKSKPSLSLSNFIDDLCQQLKMDGRVETQNAYKSTKNAWSKFFGRDNFDFIDINPNNIIRFEQASEKRGNQPNTIFLYLRTLKTIINLAKRDGVCPLDFDPFKSYSLAKFRRIKTRKRALSRDQFRKIETMVLEPESRLWHSRNYFIFSFYAGGMNLIDLALLKWDNIHDNQIVYNRKKTNELISIPLMEESILILNNYRKYSECRKNDYIFPLINESHNTAISISNRIHKINHQINGDLKEIGKTLGIDIKLTTYVARHTFANVLKKEGIPVSIIGQALGHENEKTTRIYLDSFGSDVMQQAFKKLS
jgi:integrase